jgi:hypothetical protein
VDLQNKIKVEGKIIFDPIDVTKKHQKQSSWKKVAMVHIGSDISEYYAWFIRKRYNINLTPPLRKAHITFINDRASEMNGKWKEVKKKWDGKKITITLSVDPRTDSDEPNSDAHWWLNVPEEDRKKRLTDDQLFKLRYVVKGLIRDSFRGNSISKNSKTFDILGCTIPEFKEHLESQFEDWMTWENRGLYNGEYNYGWDIDHMIPISSAETEDDVIRLNHYTNLQPLCSRVNRYDKRDN